MSTTIDLADPDSPWDHGLTQRIIDRMDTSADRSSYQEKLFERSGYASPFDIAQPDW